MRLPLALALAGALSTPAWAMAHMDLPTGYPPARSYVDGCLVGLVGALVFLLTEPFLKSARAAKTLLWGAAVLILLSAQAYAVDSDGTRPDDKLTPGEVRTMDRETICSTKTGTVRDVPDVMKIAARRNYGLMNNRAGWCAPNGCEIDHRVPLEIGGGNTRGSIANLWPQKATGPNSFHDKDRCENAAHRAICNGTLSVEAAQAIFLGDWVAGCAALMGAK